MFEFIPEDPVGEIHKWLLLDDNVLFDWSFTFFSL